MIEERYQPAEKTLLISITEPGAALVIPNGTFVAIHRLIAHDKLEEIQACRDKVAVAEY